MHLVTSCLLRKKNSSDFEKIKCLKSLISHQSNHIRDLVGFIKFFRLMWSKIELLGFFVQQSFMK